jgi:hypothetical protein
MTLDRILHEAIDDAKQAVDRSLLGAGLIDLKARRRAIAEAAADLCLERCERLQNRVTREWLIQVALHEIGD